MPCLSLKHIWRSRTSNRIWRVQRRVGRRFNAGLRFSARRLAAELILTSYPTIMLQSRQTFKKPFIYKPKSLVSQLATQPTQPATQPTIAPTPAKSTTQPASPPVSHIVNIVTPGRSRLLGPRAGWRELTHADLINAESRLGSTIFGPIPAGHRREFFHDRQGVWIWHEDWQDVTSGERQLTVRYEVRKSGVYKKISAGNYFKLEGGELENFRRAAHAYLKVIKTYLYNSAQPASA